MSRSMTAVYDRGNKKIKVKTASEILYERVETISKKVVSGDLKLDNHELFRLRILKERLDNGGWASADERLFVEELVEKMGNGDE